MNEQEWRVIRVGKLGMLLANGQDRKLVTEGKEDLDYVMEWKHLCDFANGIILENGNKRKFVEKGEADIDYEV